MCRRHISRLAEQTEDISAWVTRCLRPPILQQTAPPVLPFLTSSRKPHLHTLRHATPACLNAAMRQAADAEGAHHDRAAQDGAAVSAVSEVTSLEAFVPPRPTMTRRPGRAAASIPG